MSTFTASALPVPDAEAVPTSATPARATPRLAHVNSPRPPRLDQKKAPELRLRAADVAAICMDSGCYGG